MMSAWAPRLATILLAWSLAATACGDDAEVDRLLKLLTTAKRAEAGQRLAELGPAAVPSIVRRLQSTSSNERLVALAGLQHAWSVEAVPHVMRAARDTDQHVRQVAIRVLTHHLPPAELAQALDPLARDANPRIAGPALEMVEFIAPDAARMRDAAAKPLLWNFLVQHLPRYHTPELTEATLMMLSSESPRVRAAATAGLIEQFADDARTRKRVALLLSASQPPGVRELAAEYLRRFGTEGERPALEACQAREKDAWVLASVELALARLRTTPATRLSAADRDDMAFTPLWRYIRPAEDHPTQAMRERAVRLRAAMGLSDEPTDPPASPPPADKWIAPVRDYFDENRRSFGHLLDDPEYGRFNGNVHVGDDVAWRNDHQTVVSVSSGVVRAVRVAAESWGGLVIVEHALPDGSRACSLYGHLDPLIPVRRGQAVAVGQKLGTLGRSFTWDNGGYIAHLHVGVWSGPFDDGAWVAGYLSPAQFNGGDHGWVDPQAWLRARVEN